MKRLPITLLVVLCVLGASAPIASAAGRVPRGFFGVVVTPELLAASPTVLDGQMALMAKSGVESVRANFDWETTQPVAGVFNWSQPDAIVTAASRHHLLLLPIVEFTPRWASSHPASAWNEYAPTHPALYANFMTALVRRYGPGGSFWATHPGTPKVPVRSWQIWNEPEGTKYDWRSKPWPAAYTALLKASYRAVHRADRGATVVSGALVGLNGFDLTPWAEATALYRAGFKGYFDVLAVNAFTFAPSVADSVNHSIRILDLVHHVMVRHHDSRRPIWVTEVTWTAALNRIARKDYAGFETTPRGQAARLAAYYTKVATSFPDNIQRAFWFDWSSSYAAHPDNGDVTFQYSGLLKWQP
ncbi:MAG: polysaccharide biosynthesis protein PslG, partial [Solirubrobacteraceae bacterium]|nr:polysaccharide biosynthesis protein PslG [Solirubrobacteraceae bacterium]